MKICCIISSLAGGGAERVMALLANHWVAQGQAVTLVTLDRTETDAYALSPLVKRVDLGVEVDSRTPLQAIVHNLRKARALRHAVASAAPDVVISFVDRMNVLTLLACTGLDAPVIISERIHPSYHEIGWVWSTLRRLTYPFADALVVQSEAIRKWSEGVLPRRRTRVIPNPVGDQFYLRRDARGTARSPIVLGVGRLVPQKGFDVLIRAFQNVVRAHPEWSLVIAGQGPYEADLRRLAAELLPPTSIRFIGRVQALEQYYRDAALFVLPSRYEGFPNVLVEAMASGCAVISTACPGSSAEIVRDGFDGLLVPADNVFLLEEKMERLVAREDERRALGERATESSKRFRLGDVAGLWDRVMSDVVTGRETL